MCDAEYVREFVKKPIEFLGKHLVIPVEAGVVRGTIPKTWRDSFQNIFIKKIEYERYKKIVTANFTLKEAQSNATFRRKGKIFQLEFAQDGDECFKAYWLAYDEDKVKHATLGKDARFMFTAKMSGCTFGYGSKTPSGHILVGHANAITIGEAAAGNATINPDNAAKKAQRKAQEEQIRAKLSQKTGDSVENITTYNPRHYRDNEYCRGEYEGQATVIGIREDHDWTFFVQKIARNTSHHYRLAGLDRI